jgi:hypothetical protein
MDENHPLLRNSGGGLGRGFLASGYVLRFYVVTRGLFLIALLQQLFQTGQAAWFAIIPLHPNSRLILDLEFYLSRSANGPAISTRQTMTSSGMLEIK